MKINWKQKLTSRKFWAAAAGFLSMLLVYFGRDAGAAEQVAALVMAAGSLIAYIMGEGLADGANGRNAGQIELRFLSAQNDGGEGNDHD